MAFSAQSYLDRVIKIIRMRAMNSHLVDWEVAQKTAQEMCQGAKTTKDTYEAINYVLSLLKDNHSFLRDRSGRGTRKQGTQPERPVRHERVKRGALVIDDGKTFGFIKIPSFSGSASAAHKFTQGIQDEIRAAVEKQAVGWIVDLRGNGGGNMWPMLKGAGPLIGEGIAGHFCYPRVSIAWFYESGSVGVINAKGKSGGEDKIANPVPDQSHQPVVVLIDRNTASSGEAVAISFKGRPRSYFIGTPSAGLATNNENIKLPDGATLLLTTSCESDRNGVKHFPDVKPDLEIIQGDIAYGANDDPGILAAIEWLKGQTG